MLCDVVWLEVGMCEEIVCLFVDGVGVDELEVVCGWFVIELC